MKKVSKIIIVLVLLYICVLIFMNSSEVTDSIIFSFDIWKNNIFPSLFPFFVISNILINYGFVNITSKIFKPLTKLFKVSESASFVIVMGILSGFPSSSKYVKELVDNGHISQKEASKILTFTHFSNPLFIINTIGISFFDNYKIGILILIIHYFSNFIIGLIFRNYKIQTNKNSIITLKELSLGSIISNSITSSINTLLLILGTISFFLVITTVINNSILMSDLSNTIVSGIIEMTQGLKYVSMLNNSIKLKAILSVMFISFGGISVHMQTYSIINESNIKYFPFLIARIMHALISGFIMSVLFDFCC